MARWCNTVHQPEARTQFPNSPTPTSEEPTTPDKPDSPYSPEELKNLQKYNEYLYNLGIQLERRWPPRDTIPYDEDLLGYTLRLSPRVAPHHKGSDLEFYSDSEENLDDETLTGKEGALKRARTSDWVESDSAQKTETHQNSTIDGTINKRTPICARKQPKTLDAQEP